MPDGLSGQLHREALPARGADFSRELAALGWYHSMELPTGEIIKGYNPISELKQRYEGFNLPKDLSGKRALDIGAWDGWFSFELEEHGAEVVATDVVDLETFRHAHRLKGSKVRYETATVYDLPKLGLGTFDVVLFLGVLYHVRHPLLALEAVCAMCRDMVLIDSFVVDPGESRLSQPLIPSMEFYELDELGNQLDNWYGPSTECLQAMIRSSGFVRPQLLGVRYQHAQVIAFRHWEPEPEHPICVEPRLLSVLHYRNGTVYFKTGVEDYVSFRFKTPEPDIGREDVCVEIGGYAAYTLKLVREDSETLQGCCFLPPGLEAGWHPVRVRTRASLFGNSISIALDVSA
jgi:tRNA (mo5U34)-methyltransferase